ncbi:MAG: putative baseplate assembly protein [Ferrimicrobium sp.]|jgi:predicted phage baseplate assembly protein|uniref:Baseplate assembly protein n=1 Tax=Ferrimicrobium acidiphilum TaxID=121039 RepID=A0ABV3Y3V4_9ACTN|nr:putative baseplate assembly protein [Ferrimicrobium sp.]
MPLPTPELDDRKFQDIVDEAKRLIPRYCPEWTNHNVSDPGVALIELFAWMSETVLYRINQVPDRLYTKFLDLVGIVPFPPAVARTDLLFWLSAALDQEVLVPGGTLVATLPAVNQSEVLFSTVEDLVIRPPQLIGAKITTDGREDQFVDVWDDLRYDDSAVRCFQSDPLTAGDAAYFGFANPLGGSVIRLTIGATIEGIGVDPTDPPLAWEAFCDESWVAMTVQSDTTGGLNRDGQITLACPREMSAVTLGGTRGFWIRVRLLPTRSHQPGYKASPMLKSLVVDTLGGSVIGEHASSVNRERIGRSDGSPRQQFRLQYSPVLPLRDGEVLRVSTLESSAIWEEVEDFTGSGPDDCHYTLDCATGVISFGPRIRYPDGSIRQHGAIPPDGAELLMESYRYGGGAVGNVGADTLTVLRTSVAYIDRVTNPKPATGGVDAESPANAKLRGPLALRAGDRAVTAHDFERLAIQASPEVARVRCHPPAIVGEPVRLLVVPRLLGRPEDHQLDDFQLTDALVEAISAHLEPRRMIGTTVDISTPYYQGVTVAALLRAFPGRPSAVVQQRALDLLYSLLDPFVGGPSQAGWPFDVDLNASYLMEQLEAVDGVERVEEVLLFEADLRTGQRKGRGRELLQLDSRSLFLSHNHQVVVR